MRVAHGEVGAMGRGLKRLSAVAWAMLAAVMLLRAPVWAILTQHQEWLPAFYIAGVVLPAAGHLLTAWIVNGFTRAD